MKPLFKRPQVSYKVLALRGKISEFFGKPNFWQFFKPKTAEKLIGKSKYQIFICFRK